MYILYLKLNFVLFCWILHLAEKTTNGPMLNSKFKDNGVHIKENSYLKSFSARREKYLVSLLLMSLTALI